MPDPSEPLTPADPADLAATLAFGLRYQGHKRVHKADEIMAKIVAGKLVNHLAQAGFALLYSEARQCRAHDHNRKAGCCHAAG